MALTTEIDHIREARVPFLKRPRTEVSMVPTWNLCRFSVQNRVMIDFVFISTQVEQRPPSPPIRLKDNVPGPSAMWTCSNVSSGFVML